PLQVQLTAAHCTAALRTPLPPKVGCRLAESPDPTRSYPARAEGCRPLPLLLNPQDWGSGLVLETREATHKGVPISHILARAHSRPASSRPGEECSSRPRRRRLTA